MRAGRRMTFHFLAGLPRSGSTLLGALLRQNPRFHAGMSSPVATLFESVIAQVSAGTELSAMVDATRQQTCHATAISGTSPKPCLSGSV